MAVYRDWDLLRRVGEALDAVAAANGLPLVGAPPGSAQERAKQVDEIMRSIGRNWPDAWKELTDRIFVDADPTNEGQRATLAKRWTGEKRNVDREIKKSSWYRTAKDEPTKQTIKQNVVVRVIWVRYLSNYQQYVQQEWNKEFSAVIGDDCHGA